MMTQEDKMLLIKDLSSRLPYAVHIQHISGFSGTLYDISMHHKYDENDNIYDAICCTDFFGDGDSITIEHFKPYLFPLSSMTKEQENEYQYITERWMYDPSYSISDSTDWLNKNHFDYRGLIKKGLAIDATGLNIYQQLRKNMSIVNRIYNIQFIKDYLNYFHINKIDIKTVFHIFKTRIKCWKHGHNYSFCCKTGNSYVSVCKKCGKQSVLTLMDDNKLFNN